jgi:hypothetical protein
MACAVLNFSVKTVFTLTVKTVRAAGFTASNISREGVHFGILQLYVQLMQQENEDFEMNI